MSHTLEIDIKAYQESMQAAQVAAAKVSLNSVLGKCDKLLEDQADIHKASLKVSEAIVSDPTRMNQRLEDMHSGFNDAIMLVKESVQSMINKL